MLRLGLFLRRVLRTTRPARAGWGRPDGPSGSSWPQPTHGAAGREEARRCCAPQYSARTLEPESPPSMRDFATSRWPQAGARACIYFPTVSSGRPPARRRQRTSQEQPRPDFSQPLHPPLQCCCIQMCCHTCHCGCRVCPPGWIRAGSDDLAKREPGALQAALRPSVLRLPGRGPIDLSH